MSKLDDILNTGESDTINFETHQKYQIKDLMLEIIDDTVVGLGGDVPYGELTRKVEEL